MVRPTAPVTGTPPGGALLFTCNGRGESTWLPLSDHDAKLPSPTCSASLPTAGMFSAGELGPVGGRNFVHGFTASIALFTDGSAAGRPRPSG